MIGNANYAAAPVPNALNDAILVAETLRDIGFDATFHPDITREGMANLVHEINLRFREADVGIVYYAGHAFQVEGRNHLLPIDVTRFTPSEIKAKRVPLEVFLSAATTRRRKGLRLIILDACRNDPFSELGAEFGRGLTLEQSGEAETLIAYATAPGALASDGPRGGNGPYAIALSRLLQKEGQEVAALMRNIRRQVREATEGRQVPWVVGSTESEHWLTADERRALLDEIDSEETTLDKVLWWFLQDSVAPNELRRFIFAFPRSPFAPDAQRRLTQISQAPLPEPALPRQDLADESEVRLEDQLRESKAPPMLPSELFTIWPSHLPESAEGINTFVTDCDLRAADPTDPQRFAPGIRAGLVNIQKAAQACAYALSADPENPRLQFQLGRVLEIAELYAWGRFYYRRAAEHNYSAALVNLGYMHYVGIGTDVDYATAARYYRQASALGNLRARTNVGTLYIKGQGVAAQPEEGVLWYRLAADLGWVYAQNALGDLYRQGIGVPQDDGIAAALYRIAALNGQRDAMANLGRSYLAGRGVEKNGVAAHAWLERAVNAGDKFAPFFLARDLVETGRGRLRHNAW